MKSGNHKTFVTIFLAGFLACALGIVEFNYTMDPYGIYGNYERGVIQNQIRIVFFNLRLSKAYWAYRMKPDAMVIGTSHAGNVRCDDPAWGTWSKNCFNMAIYGATSRELLRYFESADSIRRQKTVVIGLDFFMFNANRRTVPGFEDYRLARPGKIPAGRPLPDLLSTLSSVTAIKDSVKMVLLKNNTIAVRQYRPNGDEAQPPPPFVTKENFDRSLIMVHDYYFPAPSRSFRLCDGDGCATDDLKEIVAIARREGIDLRLYISPDHAWTEEMKRMSGLWPEYEEWKRQLVRIAAPARPGERAIPLWDFSGYNSVTTQELPLDMKTKIPILNYGDAHHFSRAIGSRILERVLGSARHQAGHIRDFGTALHRDNVEQHLARTRAAQAAYEQTHPGDLAAVEAVLRKLLKPGSK